MAIGRSNQHPITIPIDICRNNDLTFLARLLYGEIDRLSLMNQGNFSIEELAKCYNLPQYAIRDALDELVSQGFIRFTTRNEGEFNE